MRHDIVIGGPECLPPNDIAERHKGERIMEINISDLLLWERSLSGCNYKPAMKVHNAIRAALKMHGTGRPFGIKTDRCEWKIDQDGFYNTSCNNAFTIDFGTPKENKMLYCPFCGLEIKEAQQVIQPDNAQ